MPVGEQRQHELMNQILLANNLLPQPVFEVRKELVIHGSGLRYCGVRNSVISDHYKARTFKKPLLDEGCSGEWSET
jgi:hypothetical protein